MADLDENLSNLFSDLKRFEKNGEYEKALNTTNKILKINPNNEKSIHCKTVSLIQLNKFEEALNFIKQSSELISSKLLFEKSYCEYRLNKVEDALSSLKLADSTVFEVNELKTQALYRQENFQECYSNYIDLIKNSSDDYEDERYVNLTAVFASLFYEKNNSKLDLLDLNENTYEIIYNKACILIASGDYESAIKKLNEAEVFCAKFLEEDGASEEEIEIELAIIRAQIAFCMQKLNKNDVALKTYNQILRQKLSDIALIAVVSNNIVAIHKDQNLFDSKKKIKIALNENTDFKLSANQKRNIHCNYCLFLINTHQFEMCRKHLEIFKTKFPNYLSDICLIESFLLIKEKNLSQAINVLNEFCFLQAKLSISELEVVFLLVQLLIKEQKFNDAAKTIEALDESVKYYPAIVSTLYMIYEKINNIKAVENLFSNAIKWHEEKNSSGDVLSVLYREASKFYLNQNKPQSSVKYLEKIIQINGKNPKIISMLINAYSQFDLSKAQILKDELPSIEQILSSVDIEHLENKNWSLGVKYVKKSKDTPKVSDKKKKKKKRNKLLPKNYNPNEQPDPERWLPKYERSTYRKKKDKKGVGKGTQGAVAGEGYEIKPSPKQAITSPPGPRQQRPTQKKKKKGGRK